MCNNRCHHSIYTWEKSQMSKSSLSNSCIHFSPQGHFQDCRHIPLKRHIGWCNYIKALGKWHPLVPFKSITCLRSMWQDRLERKRPNETEKDYCCARQLICNAARVFGVCVSNASALHRNTITRVVHRGNAKWDIKHRRELRNAEHSTEPFNKT